MRLLIVAALFEELSVLVEAAPFDRTNRTWQIGPETNALLVGPGVQKRRELRRAIESLDPEAILLSGLVGGLRPKQQVGERAKIGWLVDAGEWPERLPAALRRQSTDDQSKWFKADGVGLATVKRPVFAAHERRLLAAESGCDWVDMEAARLIELQKKLPVPANRIPIHYCRVCGDTASEATLFVDEPKLRKIMATTAKSRLQQLLAALRFPGGPLRFMKLRRFRSYALRRLHEEMQSEINILQGGGGQWSG